MKYMLFEIPYAVCVNSKRTNYYRENLIEKKLVKKKTTKFGENRILIVVKNN